MFYVDYYRFLISKLAMLIELGRARPRLELGKLFDLVIERGLD